jgi:hypothetical protein
MLELGFFAVIDTIGCNNCVPRAKIEPQIKLIIITSDGAILYKNKFLFTP